MNKLSVEELIQNAQNEGAFTKLPGQGKPLRLDTSPDAVVNGLLKQANVKPEWVEIAQAIDDLLESAAQLLSRYEQQYTARYTALMTNPAETGDGRIVSQWRQ